jgi:hypothetical protein
MTISITGSGSMSPKDQFSFDKKDLFFVGSITAGTGATTSGGSSAMSGHYYQIKAPDTDIGYASLCIYTPLLNRGANQYNGVDWSKKFIFGFRALRKVGTGADANSEFKVFLGKSYNVTGGTNRLEPTASDKAVGIKQVGAGPLQLMYSNGTTVTTITTSFTPVNQQAYDVIIECWPNSVYLYINDVLIAQGSGSPASGNGTGETQLMSLWATCENNAVLTGSNHSAIFADYFISPI